MPKYDVAFKDGRVVTVEAPEGANNTQIGMLAIQQLRAQEPPPPPARTLVSAPDNMPCFNESEKKLFSNCLNSMEQEPLIVD